LFLIKRINNEIRKGYVTCYERNSIWYGYKILLCLKLFYSKLGIQCQIEQRLKKKNQRTFGIIQKWDIARNALY
jgi:hypothetical protein